MHGDFAAQSGTHTFAWQGEGGSTVELRARYSFMFRRDDRSRRGGSISRNDGGGGGGGVGWAIVEHCSFAMTSPTGGNASTGEVLKRVSEGGRDKRTNGFVWDGRDACATVADYVHAGGDSGRDPEWGEGVGGGVEGQTGG